MNAKLLRLLALPAALLVCGCGGARKSALNPAYEVEKVEAEGSAPVVDGADAARKAALGDALRNALALVVGVYVSQESMVSQAVLIDETITSQTEGYIEKYETLKEWRDGDFFKVRVLAHVRKEDLTLKLRDLEPEPVKLGNPVICFAVAETVDGARTEASAAATELKSVFAGAGFLTGEGENCDITIKGSADSAFNTREGLGGFVSYRATLSLSADKAGGGALAAVQDAAGGIDLNDSAAARAAVINAVKKAGPDLKDRLLKALKEKSVVRLSLSGVKDMNHLSDYMKSLKNIPAIRGSWLRNYSGSSAHIDVGLRKGGAQELSALLQKNQKFPLKIVRSGAYDIEGALP
ncbi:MAG: flagellar assembly protein T N-terminal domain-containing protein [Elusimicrobiales bacterium]|jgi:hypothetical protein|nr:flagellar assembly protein T N-terminal domain-containing protein [Elusimicrobiales bacterium]